MKTGEKLRLVIADDDQTTVRVLARLLKREENVDLVGRANNGVEAIVLTEDLRPDVLLLDYQMPLAAEI